MHKFKVWGRFGGQITLSRDDIETLKRDPGMFVTEYFKNGGTLELSGESYFPGELMKLDGLLDDADDELEADIESITLVMKEV